MVEPGQIRAARGLLGWRQQDLAKAAELGVATIRRIEAQQTVISAHVSTILRLQKAFEHAGIQFLETNESGGLGVRLVSPKLRNRPRLRT